MKKNQEDIFINQESDAWFDRNSSKIVEPVSTDHNVIKAVLSINLPKSGSFIDLGGGVGSVSARIKKLFPDWKGTVLEPSQKARNHGSKIFPLIDFAPGSLAKKEDMPIKDYDLVIISMVLTWIDRTLLTQAIANIDNLVKPGGHIIIQDFYTPFPRANNYHHTEGVLTYKQDYPLLFTSTNLYTEILKDQKYVSHSTYDESDPYDCCLMTSVLRKDLFERYRKSPSKLK